MAVRPPADFDAAFGALKELLARHQRSLVVARDQPGDFLLVTRKDFRGQPMCFGGVTIRKNYVSFHLMPVYVEPKLLEGISPGLRKRMQGKSCFNFKRVEEELFAELRGLAKDGLDHFRKVDLA
ncbi:MAG: hypothetical protein H8E31_08620 [Planctomycetes bacterium]|nr:hypothetical protein [Planctomycetota bacterium]